MSTSMSDRVCQFYLRGRCQRENCEFRHDRSAAVVAGAGASNVAAGAGGGEAASSQLCRFYQMGNCKFRNSCRWESNEASFLLSRQIELWMLVPTM